MSFNLSDIGVALSGFIGNGGQAYATGLSAAVYQKTTELQNDIRNAVYGLGKNLGPILGTAIPDQLAAGANQTGANAVSNFEQKYFGFSVSNLVLGIGLFLLVGVIWMLTRLRRR